MVEVIAGNGSRHAQDIQLAVCKQMNSITAFVCPVFRAYIEVLEGFGCGAYRYSQIGEPEVIVFCAKTCY